MAAASAQVTIPANTTAQALVAAGASDSVSGDSVSLRNEGTVSVRLGGSDVSRANGQLFQAGETLGLDVAQGESLFAVNTSDSSAGLVSVLRVK